MASKLGSRTMTVPRSTLLRTDIDSLLYVFSPGNKHKQRSLGICYLDRRGVRGGF